MDETNIQVLNKPDAPNLITRTIGIDGMTCDRCVETVERMLKGAKGVREVRVDREQARATVTFDPAQTDVPDLHDRLLKSGYTPKRSTD